MLTTRITHPLPPPTGQDSIDIFSSSLSALFTDDTQNSHGTPGSHIVYSSPRFGDLTLDIPPHPDVEEGRKLFAHYLWNAGVLVAEGIEQGSSDEGNGVWDRRWWDVRGKRILELGAGTALPSLISALSHASTVMITDHPSSPALCATSPNTIALNIKHNLFPPSSPPRTAAKVSVCGYVWGETVMYSAVAYGKPVSGLVRSYCDRIIIADCLWMQSQHENLVRTICHFLEDGQGESCAIVVAGFHTGRAIVRDFFVIATGVAEPQAQAINTAHHRSGSEGTEEPMRSPLKAVEMFEMDVDGARRNWLSDRPGENRDDAKRWCVVAVLVKS